jgi:hypothetical protein
MRIVWGLGMMWWMSAYWIALGSRKEQAAVGFRVRFVECDSDPSEDAWLPFAEANQLSAMGEYLDLPQTES